jgi:DNA-binding transcriptional ArsR family regulator
MRKAESVEAGDGRLPAGLAAMLGPELQDALDHPFRRDVLRALDRSGRARSVAELGAELPALRRGQLSYHLRVLRRLGVVASEAAGDGAGPHALYASAVFEDDGVRAVLRATERWDRKRRDVAAAANASQLLTMFRVPRPVRTIRLRGQGRPAAERDR